MRKYFLQMLSLAAIFVTSVALSGCIFFATKNDNKAKSDPNAVQIEDVLIKWKDPSTNLYVGGETVTVSVGTQLYLMVEINGGNLPTDCTRPEEEWTFVGNDLGCYWGEWKVAGVAIPTPPLNNLLVIPSTASGTITIRVDVHGKNNMHAVLVITIE
jgi:hypothetical protein